jgi:heat shock protein HslJ
MRMLSFGALVLALVACASDSSISSGSSGASGSSGSSSGDVVSPALTGDWQLEDARDAAGVRVEVLVSLGTNSRPTLKFLDDGRVFANGGCNRANGEYHIDRQGRLVIEDLGLTGIWCDEELGRIDEAVVDVLKGSAEWSIEESSPERLRLNYVDGRTAVWVAREPSEP